MSGQSVVVLGGGFGGAAAALAARRALSDEHRVTVIDRATSSRLCGTNPLVMVGVSDETSRSITSLSDHDIDVITAEVTGIDLDGRRVATSGDAVPYDYLVVALGASYDWEAVEGAADTFSFYAYDQACRLADRLADFDGGSIVIGVAAAPYKCPPAPFEGAMMIDWYLRERGVRGAASLAVAIPEPEPLAIAGQEAVTRIREAMHGRGIDIHTRRALTAAADGHARFSDESTLEADVVIQVPRHTLPAVIAESGLADGQPWLVVDPATLETSVPNVFAIGDCNVIPVGDKALPKAGTFASGQGALVGSRIAAHVNEDRVPADYGGTGYCYVSFGRDAAALVGGTFLRGATPDVKLGVPSPRAMIAKRRWEIDWEMFRI